MQWYSPVAFNKFIHRSLIRSWHISWGSRCNCGEAEGKGGAWARWAGSEPVGWVLACCCSPVGWGGCRNAAPMSDSSAPWCLKASRISLHTMNFKILQDLTRTLQARLSEMIPEQTSRLKTSWIFDTTSNLLVQLLHFRKLDSGYADGNLWFTRNLENLLAARNTKASSQTSTHHSGLNLALSGWN